VGGWAGDVGAPQDGVAACHDLRGDGGTHPARGAAARLRLRRSPVRSGRCPLARRRLGTTSSARDAAGATVLDDVTELQI
jgi:hypothetical protein